MPRFLRPPMGCFNHGLLRVVAERGYRPVLGDVYPQDTARPGRDVIVHRVLERIAPGSIVILHDGSLYRRADRSQSLDAVEALLPRLRDLGYALGTVSELVASEAREAAGGASEPAA